MAQILRFLIASSLAAGSKAFGPRRNNITQRDDVHGCRTFLCKGGAVEFNGYMKTDIPRSDGRLYGMVEVYDTETQHRRAVTENDVFTLSVTENGAAPASLAAGTSGSGLFHRSVTASGPEGDSGDGELTDAAGSNINGLGSSPQEGAAGEAVVASSADVEGAPTLLERIEAAVAAKAKTFAALAEELGVEVPAVKEATKDQEHLQTTGGWVKLVS